MQEFTLQKVFVVAVACFFADTVSLHAVNPPPAMDWTITKVLGAPRYGEITYNRTVPFAGSHLGGVYVDTSHRAPCN
jgi:hypothetical protein